MKSHIPQSLRSTLAEFAISYRMLADQCLHKEITIDEYEKLFDALIENYALKIKQKKGAF